jgi:carbamoyl-phosphate synthase small subunit
MRASLLLEDGTVFHGQGLGIETDIVGEIVFNTAMSGYEEVISDPSYLGQIVLFTTSHIGNTGITIEDLESNKMYAEGMICKNVSLIPDNHRSRFSLDSYLKEQKKCAIYDIDTRLLTQKIRSKGCMAGILSTADHDIQSLTNKLKSAPKLGETNAVDLYQKENRFQKLTISNKNNSEKYRVAVLDFGIKQGILNSLIALHCEPILFPLTCSIEDIKAIQPDGLFFSNGPGDPSLLANETNIISIMQELLPLYPSFGICLGHQLIGLSFGAKIKKLRFGHHAINHPVKSLLPGSPSVLITSQNHNYIVDIENLEDIFEVTYSHLNDGTLAGMRHKKLPIYSVQFHPESNPGPRDAEPIFKDFINSMEKRKKMTGVDHA